jgi:hypothetical protein
VSKRCEEHSKRWRVIKRDGTWQALDHRGRLRYAAEDWLMVLTFAQVRSPQWTPVHGIDPAMIRKQIEQLRKFFQEGLEE